MPYSVLVAGSTHRTLECVQALAADKRFDITGVITPPPKAIGRNKTVTTNPVHAWATAQKLPTVLIEKKLGAAVQTKLKQFPQPDFLLVVDFGYLVPPWLLELPQLAPVNIHPSALPKWRGSSPAQFVLLHSESVSAVSIMIMSEKLDAGAILKQIPFQVSENWTQTEYYTHSFQLASAALPETLVGFAKELIDPHDQPVHSPTPIARRLKKLDGFVPWDVIATAMQADTPRADQLPELLQAATKNHQSVAQTLVSASKALQPWPGLWTLIPTSKGETRMKLLELELRDGALLLSKVHVAGHDNPAPWKQVKSILKNN